MPRPAFDAFIAPARGTCGVWRTVVGAALIVIIYAGSLASTLGMAVLILGPDRAYELASRLAQPATPRATLFLLATFVGMGVAPMAVVWTLHGRPVSTLFGRAPRVLRDFVICAVVVCGFYGLSIGAWSLFFEAQRGLPADVWLTLLPLTLLGLLVQTGAEELVFRGYLTQQLAARFGTPLAWLVVPSILFGLVHYAPAATGGNVWLLVAGATLFGLFAADLTAASGSIGAAWGFHFANNLVALAVLATDGTITGLALYLTPYTADAEGMARLAFIADYGILAVAWGSCRLLVRR